MPESADLLVWYDRQRRSLPWRAEPDEVADPYRVWLSEIMLQQTTVAAVKPYFAAFLARFPTVQALANAPSEEVMQAWAGLGYYSRARNLHACAKAVVEHCGGKFPASEAALLALPGIGPYTAAAVASIAFNQVAAAVDGNVERVMTRLFAIETLMPAAKVEVKRRTLAAVPPDRPGDFAQALMDLGATICTPHNPACALCPWVAPCQARARGDQTSFPRKGAKPARPTRCGAAYVVLRADNALLLRTRPPKGLLGSMAEVPVSDWAADYDLARARQEAPLALDWQRVETPVRHVFTHFPLELTVFAARAPTSTKPTAGARFTPLADLGREPLPGVMLKAVEAGLGLLGVPLPAKAVEKS
ncbi:MAG: A/G-specific adenine glycosylase [Bosea sp. (in: a-proteobacteria)]